MLPERVDTTAESQPVSRVRTCPTCNGQFTPETERQFFCAPDCRPSHQKPELVMAVRPCPECNGEFTCHPSHRQIYCSPACRKAAEVRRESTRNEKRAHRLGEGPAPRTGPPVRAELPAPPPPPARPAPRQPAKARDPLAPAATRNCPHCDQPITIVALLATPEAARPVIHPARDAPPLRRVP